MINLTQSRIMQNWDTDNSDTPLVSVRCITYNHEPYIAQALDGFLMQKTNFPFEVIVHDDASTDRTAEIIREYEARFPKIIKPIYETENQYSKRDGSLRRIMDAACKGKYIAFCEGDDYWIDENKLQRQVDFLEKNDSYSISSENSYILFTKTNRITLFSYYPECDLLKEDLLIKRRFATGSVLCKSIHIKQLSTKYDLYDIHYWCLLSEKGKIHYSPIVSSVYRRGAGVTESNKYLWVYQSEKINRSLNTMFSIPKYIKLQRNKTLYYDYLNGIKETLLQRKIKHLFILVIKFFFNYNFLCLFVKDILRKNEEKQLKKNIKKFNIQHSISKKYIKDCPKLIVSLTSQPDRYSTLNICLKSLLWQEVRPNKIILNVYQGEAVPLPTEVLEFQRFGLEIKYVSDNLKSHMKYLYVMKENPNDIIITVNDNCVYDKKMVKNLLKSYKKFPTCVSASIVHRIVKKDNFILPYSEWENENISENPSDAFIAIGFGGVLYPPSNEIFDNELFNNAKIKETFLGADDLWLKFMELRNGIKVVKAPNYTVLLCQIDETKQTEADFSNTQENKNDAYIKLLQKEYNISLLDYV